MEMGSFLRAEGFAFSLAVPDFITPQRSGCDFHVWEARVEEAVVVFRGDLGASDLLSPPPAPFSHHPSGLSTQGAMPERLQGQPLPPPSICHPSSPPFHGDSDGAAGATVSGMARVGWGLDGPWSMPQGKPREGTPGDRPPALPPFLHPTPSPLPRCQLTNLWLPWLFSVTYPICLFLCVQHMPVSIPYLQFKLETGVAL